MNPKTKHKKRDIIVKFDIFELNLGHFICLRNTNKKVFPLVEKERDRKFN